MKLPRPLSKTILVVETDNVTVRTAIVAKEGENVKIKDLVQVDAVEATKAFRVCLKRLKSKGTRLPRNAILITGEATPALVDLPIKKSMPLAQIQQMIHWEMEPHLETCTIEPMLETVANALGAISHEKREEINHYLSAYAGASRPPFRDVAMSLGAIKADSVECWEQLIETWPENRGNPVYGWTQNFASIRDDNRCLVGAIPSSSRDRWDQLFAENKLNLRGIFPLATSSLPAFNGPVTQGKSAILGASVGLTFCTWIENDSLTSIEWFHQDINLLPNTLAEVLGTRQPQKIQAAGRILSSEPFMQELQNLFSAPSSPDMSSTLDLPLAPIIGASRQFFGLKSPLKSAVLAPRAPGPALRKRPLFWWLTTTGLVSTIVGALLMVNKGRIANLEAQREEAIKSLDQTEVLASKVEEYNAEVARYKTEKERLRAQLDEALELDHFFTNTLYNQNRNVNRILDTVIGAINEGVILEAFSSNHSGGFDIAGWSVSENRAHEFVNGLAKSLANQEFKIKKLSIFVEDFQFAPSKYRFEFSLDPKSSAEGNPKFKATIPKLK